MLPCSTQCARLLPSPQATHLHQQVAHLVGPQHALEQRRAEVQHHVVLQPQVVAQLGHRLVGLDVRDGVLGVERVLQGGEQVGW